MNIDLEQPITIDPKLDHIKRVLELMIFTTGPIAEDLRKGGYDIPRKAESEQRLVMLWCLNLQKQFGTDWKIEGEKLLKEYRNKK